METMFNYQNVLQKNIKIGDEIIGGSNMINFLGINIDNNLSFKGHSKKSAG